MINPEANSFLKVTVDKIDNKISIIIAGSALDNCDLVQQKSDLLNSLLSQLNGNFEIVSEGKFFQSIRLLLGELIPRL
jgi:hypothetical protein